jgi:hypothetical protein
MIFGLRRTKTQRAIRCDEPAGQRGHVRLRNVPGGAHLHVAVDDVPTSD